tara:strand:+ start:7880 stop:8356 length:477 start_codon:yes stop_codon:yes gene_type:complete
VRSEEYVLCTRGDNMIGNTLRDRNNQYVATKDSLGTWRVLDTWHDDLRALDPDGEIPDDSEAVTIITEGAFLALVKEASRLGVLANAAFTEQTDMEREILDKESEVLDLREKLVKYEEDIFTLKQQPDRSEGFVLKEMAMNTLLKLTSMSDIQTLSKD